MNQDSGPITREEMFALFGEQVPMEAIALIWNEPETTTIGQVRAKLRQIAMARKAPTLIERLRSEAVNWSATCGDLFGEAADEIERLTAELKAEEQTVYACMAKLKELQPAETAA